MKQVKLPNLQQKPGQKQMIMQEMEGIVLVTKLDLNDKKTQSRLRD